MKYQDFIQSKQLIFQSIGFAPGKLNPLLFPFQRDITNWSLRKGRACLFEDCGLGKTIQQLEWAKQISEREHAPVLIVAPLTVSRQTQIEGKKFGYDVKICESLDNIQQGINITNYEKLHKFTAKDLAGVVLDESSILKNMAGATRNQIIEMFCKTPYRLACTATPSPNDYMELGNHAEFLGVMSYSEMLSMFFVNDSGDTGKWRLRKHADERKFWQWLCSWSVMLTKPSDLGYDQAGFDLPPLRYHEHKIPAINTGRYLFTTEASTMQERNHVRGETVGVRCKKAAEIANSDNDQWVIWCDRNPESELLAKLVNDAVEITGSTSMEDRERYMLGFTDGSIKRLVTKPSIAGFGMNWQNCHKTAFVGLSDSWEKLYQATRRLWRFGQLESVDVHIIIEEREGKVLENIKRKDRQAKYMIANMVRHTKDITKKQLQSADIIDRDYNPDKEMVLPTWIN